MSKPAVLVDDDEPLDAAVPARSVAAGHHGRGDGRGHPDGRAVGAMPLPARPMVLAD